MTNRHIIIPARLQSTRLADKLLLEIAGKPIIEHVYSKAKTCDVDSVTVATDSIKIATVVEQLGGAVCMTRANHQSGTDRLAEVVEKLNFSDDDIIINLQGDEPLVPVENLTQAADLLINKPHAVMATLCEHITDIAEINDPNCVKVVFDQAGFALYFSRASIPFERNGFDIDRDKLTHYYRHIGLYAYRASFLKSYAKMAKSPLEQIESLEQLRILWHGYKIAIATAKSITPPGIDTQADLDNVRALYEQLQTQ